MRLSSYFDWKGVFATCAGAVGPREGCDEVEDPENDQDNGEVAHPGGDVHADAELLEARHLKHFSQIWIQFEKMEI